MEDSAEERLLTRLHRAMIEFDRGDPKRIQHFAKVHSYARLIAQLEGLPAREQFIVETAAYVHDIGIQVAEEKYGYQNGKLQEKEGPDAARALLTGLGFDQACVDRAAVLVGRQHTYEAIDGLDCQILVEADFLVNLFEDGDVSASRATAVMRQRAAAVGRGIFRTRAGLALLSSMFGLEGAPARQTE